MPALDRAHEAAPDPSRVKDMRILQLAPLVERVPPRRYGGTEAVVSLLTEELVRLGHDVTLAASGDSVTAAQLISSHPRSLRLAEDIADRGPYEWMHVALALATSAPFDIVHNHAGELPMAFADLIDVPMLTTVHCLPTEDSAHVWARYRRAWNTISRAERALVECTGVPGRFTGHVYNAVDVESFPFERDKADYLLFLSRIAPEKGVHLAIQVARRLHRRLIIAGNIGPNDRAYFEELIRPEIDGTRVVFLGEVDGVLKRRLYARASCLLMPLLWEEPFGLVMAEAMAAGTPVVALRRGAVEEIVLHGRTGFVVDTADEMLDAVLLVGSMDSAACRDHVARNFSPRSMASRYAETYASLLGRDRSALPPGIGTIEALDDV